MSTPISDIFGWHCPCASQFEDEKIAKGCLTVLNIAGYIPVVGTISGIVRNSIFVGDFCSRGEFMDLGERRFNQVMIARGVVECFSIGAVFLLPDIMVTIVRYCCDCSDEEYETLGVN